MTVALRKIIGLSIPACLLAVGLSGLTDSSQAQTPTNWPAQASLRSTPRGYQPRLRSAGYATKPGRTASTVTADKTEKMEKAEKAVEGPPLIEANAEPEILMGDAAASCDACVGDGPGFCDACQADPCGCVMPFRNLELLGGVQAFTGPANRGGSGSFGFHEGLNWAFPIPGLPYLGGQMGFRAVHSNFSGAGFTTESRNQFFVTGGLFRRVDAGFQGGIVADYLSDGWYRDASLLNLRGELSWKFCGVHDLGFWMSTSTKESQVTATLFGQVPQTERWEGTDLYAVFYRREFGERHDGDARLFAGWSGQSDGLLGADIRLPLRETLAFEAGFAYLIPQEGSGPVAGGQAQESWNLSVGLVWYPGRRCGATSRYYRPLFRVADNGTFMMDQLP